MIDVITPGLETSVQDYPGRIGFWNQGFPPSGPMDSGRSGSPTCWSAIRPAPPAWNASISDRP